MNVTYIGHAGLYIETKDCKILCDPWKHENPQFFRSWYVYPDNSNLDWKKMMTDVTFLYVSHMHNDHLDRVFLRELSNNSEIKVILPDYRYCRLKEELQSVGFKNFIIEGGKIGDTEFFTYPSETISREREDSSLLVDDGNITFLNVNDSTINSNHQNDIHNRFGDIDMIACQFSGASWWPLCYDNYSEKEMIELCREFKNRKIVDYFRLINKLKVKKTVTTAGPPCFFDKKMVHLNYYGHNASVFYDGWDIQEFDDRNDIFRVIPGDKFTYNSIVDRKERPFDKEKFIQSRIYEDNETITKDEFKLVKNKFTIWFTEILKNSTWLNKYIFGNIYISIENHEDFCLNFKKGSIKAVNKIEKKGIYYIIKIPGRIFYKLVTEKCTDWEEAFLSLKIRFERYPDKYNPWILSFFRNLNIEQLNRIQDVSNSYEVQTEMIEIGEYEVSRYCPHQQYDLLYHGVVDLKNKSIECLGHGWKWCLESGNGKNCSIDIESKKIRN